jgi:hypothetical protein
LLFSSRFKRGSIEPVVGDCDSRRLDAKRHKPIADASGGRDEVRYLIAEGTHVRGSPTFAFDAHLIAPDQAGQIHSRTTYQLRRGF